jgi:hypothetical protein
MELDSMKDIWKGQNTGVQKSLNENELMTMISHPSKSPVAKMKRTLKKELYFVIVCFSVAALVFFLTFENKFIGFSLAYIFLMLVFIIYYFFKNRLLTNMQCVTCEVKSNLTMQANTLEKYIKNNLIVSTLVYPAFLMFGAWLLYTGFYSETPKSIISYSSAYSPWITTLIWLVFSIITTIPLYYLNKKYLHWLYGKHINRIKRVLSEIEGE